MLLLIMLIMGVMITVMTEVMVMMMTKITMMVMMTLTNVGFWTTISRAGRLVRSIAGTGEQVSFFKLLAS